jgi:hypothetical protein
MKETTGRDTWRFGKTAALLFVNGRPIVTSMTVARSSVSMLAHPVLQRPGAAALPSALPRRNRLCVGSAGTRFYPFQQRFRLYSAAPFFRATSQQTRRHALFTFSYVTASQS